MSIPGTTLVESSGRRFTSDYPEQRSFRFDLTLEPLPGAANAPNAALVGLRAVVSPVVEDGGDAPTVYESTVKYVVQRDTAFSPEVAPDFARVVWDRLREDTVRLGLQFELAGLPVPATVDDVVRGGPAT